MTERIVFQAGKETLEGILEMNSPAVGMIVTHPHPLYGGTMDDPVVAAIVSSGRNKGYSLLTFNFRGVGNSTGHYENGIGEQEDVRAAVTYFGSRGIKIIHLAGYSFGTFVNAGALRSGIDVLDLILISPPVALMDFGPSSPLPGISLVITGSRDEIAPAGPIEKILPSWNPNAKLEIIPGADHFYTGYRTALTKLLIKNI